MTCIFFGRGSTFSESREDIVQGKVGISGGSGFSGAFLHFIFDAPLKVELDLENVAISLTENFSAVLSIW